jgi:hypothetical protein
MILPWLDSWAGWSADYRRDFMSVEFLSDEQVPFDIATFVYLPRRRRILASGHRVETRR